MKLKELKMESKTKKNNEVKLFKVNYEYPEWIAAKSLHEALSHYKEQSGLTDDEMIDIEGHEVDARKHKVTMDNRKSVLMSTAIKYALRDGEKFPLTIAITEF